MCKVCSLAINTRNDPTGTGGIRRALFAQVRERTEGMIKEVRAYVNQLPVSVEIVPDDIVINRKVYHFDLVDRDTDAEIRRIVERWFDTGGDGPPPRWFFGQQVSQAYTAGGSAEAARVTALGGQAAVPAFELGIYQSEQILQTPAFRSRVDKVYRRAFEEMKGFTADTVTDLARTLGDGVAQGIGPRRIGANISKRFGVAKSRAERIARTEIGVSYRDARREMAVDARDRLGLNILMQWISALAPTTRPHHATRHTLLYSPEQVAAFYSRDANSINCLCSQQSVIVTKSGEVLGKRKMTQRDAAEIEAIAA